MDIFSQIKSKTIFKPVIRQWIVIKVIWKALRFELINLELSNIITADIYFLLLKLKLSTAKVPAILTVKVHYNSTVRQTPFGVQNWQNVNVVIITM